ncbi:unnamed protein product [Cuscuta epithymum]|uniref:Uncharacterized protein n=1 Tax=Cuscuta epithymum TaxID=186058 RepID=A0AAV0CPF6_9ASTE|nr:unnamed protein product [Cuscuta epithymum]
MVSEVNAGPHMMPTPVFRVATKSSEVGEMPSLSSPLEQSSNRQNFDITKLHSNEIPKTPPRSPSREIYREDSLDDVHSIPRAHLALVDPVSCQKRELQKNPETDKKRKEAALPVRKRMHGSRAYQIMAALRGTQSESAVDKKKRRMMASSPIKGSSSDRHKVQQNLETDKKRKESALQVRKIMPGSRANQLMAALRGTQCESAVDKKKRRMMASSPIKGSSSDRHKVQQQPIQYFNKVYKRRNKESIMN